jgi:hypothetical protein
MFTGNPLRPIGAIASAAAAFAPMAMATAAHADQPAHMATGDSHHLDATTTLGVCAPNLGGVKVPTRSLVGYFRQVNTGNGVFNKLKHRDLKLEFRLENVTDNCVESDPALVTLTVDEISCQDSGVVLNPSIAVLKSTEFVQHSRRFNSEFLMPEAKSCYSITTAAPGATEIVALFRSK